MKLIDSADFYQQLCQESASENDRMPESGRSSGFEVPVITDVQLEMDVEAIKEQAKTRMEQIKLIPRHFKIMRFNIAKKLAMTVAECEALDVRIELGSVSGYITFTGRRNKHFGTGKRKKYLHGLLWLNKCADIIQLGCFKSGGQPLLHIYCKGTKQARARPGANTGLRYGIWVNIVVRESLDDLSIDIKLTCGTSELLRCAMF
ncbi:MAG: hypothetical protein J6M20_04305 [Clostridia bacterium]|nr:hypothetical protein [Clostridia bacterium]